MSRHFYTAPTATVAATPPNGTHHALVCPGAPNFSIVMVLRFHDDASEDAWEALPGVNEHYLENMGLTAPAAAITAFAPWGATAGMTLRQLFGVVRTGWPAWRT